MARRRKLERYRPDAIAAVLDGSAAVDVTELVALIAGANPTRRTLDPAERARRYAEKARLQSLLLRRFPDSVEVFPTARRGIVGLRLRDGRGDAGHAALSDLEPDVRPNRDLV